MNTADQSDTGSMGFARLAVASQNQFFGRAKDITEQQRQLIAELTTDPYILDEERTDIESFISRFPLLWKSYIPVNIIGEGTFSTVYKAIDVLHNELENREWVRYSRQDPEDAPKLLAYVQKLMEGWSDFFDNQHSRSEEERKEHLNTFSNLNMSIKNYVHSYVNRLLSMNYDGKGTSNQPPPISPHFVALKRINPTSSPERLIDEIRFLKELGGKHNVIPVIAGLRYQDQVIVVFPYFHCPDFREYLGELSVEDISCYMRLLFEALAHIHSHRVIHRDIKPSNFLFSAGDKRAVLVDFGLAQKEGQEDAGNNGNATNSNNSSNNHNPPKSRKGEEIEKQVGMLKERLSKLPPGIVVNDNRPAMKASRAGTRGFRAPEVLFKCPNQTCGVILLTILTQRYPFFQSSDDQDAIVEIGCIFGNIEMQKVAAKYGRTWRCDVPTVPEGRTSWDQIVATFNPAGTKTLPKEAYDMLDKCLRMDVKERISAKEALEHPFIKMYL